MSNALVHTVASVGGLIGGFIGAWLGVKVSRNKDPFPETAEVLILSR